MYPRKHEAMLVQFTPTEEQYKGVPEGGKLQFLF